MDTKRGQAVIELSLGILTLALVAAMVFVFTRIVLARITNLRPLRVQAGERALASDIIEKGDYLNAESSASVPTDEAAVFGFGGKHMRISDSVSMPGMAIDLRAP